MKVTDSATYTVRKQAERYGIAIGCFAISALARVALNFMIGTDLPYITFFPAVMVPRRSTHSLSAARLTRLASDYLSASP